MILCNNISIISGGIVQTNSKDSLCILHFLLKLKTELSFIMINENGSTDEFYVKWRLNEK